MYINIVALALQISVILWAWVVGGGGGKWEGYFFTLGGGGGGVRGVEEVLRFPVSVH
jgi:hypothetical protein